MQTNLCVMIDYTNVIKLFSIYNVHAKTKKIILNNNFFELLVRKVHI